MSQRSFRFSFISLCLRYSSICSYIPFLGNCVDFAKMKISLLRRSD